MLNQRILTIQDISCVGQCSLTVALPIISACGLETCILPSAVLSTHTGGFTGYTFRDLTEDIPKIYKHWQKEGIAFDAIYTGYLGSAKQIDYVLDVFQEVGLPGCIKIVDPAMGDNGKLYPGFDEAFALKMASLCAEADIILPNITEACFLTGTVYLETYDEAYIDGLLQKLSALGAKSVILTGVGYTPEQTGVVVYEQGKKRYYGHRKISIGSHGTGDVYASAFTGALLRGHEKYEAVKIAADYTVECILNTINDPEHWYGVKFEAVLPKLIEAVNR
ncbi:Pyridoxine kinase [bioreactor metagenome]|uniref:pyridoxal kinase n=1 Tax=bioreactor metagenome TaxID=1076179 RepID=A0A645EQ84_9ZZZZ